MGAMGSPTVRMVAALVMIGAIMVLLQLPSAYASSYNGRPRPIVDAPLSAPVGAPLGAPLSAPVGAPLGAPSGDPVKAPVGGLLGAPFDRSMEISFRQEISLSRRYLSANVPEQSPGGTAPPHPVYASPPAPPVTNPAGVPFSSPPSPPRGASSSGSPSSKSQTALIAGLAGTLGAVLGATLVGFLVFWCLKRRKFTRGRNDQDKSPYPRGIAGTKVPILGMITGTKDPIPRMMAGTNDSDRSGAFSLCHPWNMVICLQQCTSWLSTDTYSRLYTFKGPSTITRNFNNVGSVPFSSACCQANVPLCYRPLMYIRL